jgi:hypothetical protein
MRSIPTATARLAHSGVRSAQLGALRANAHSAPRPPAHGLLAAAHLQLTPDTNALPGGNVLQHLMNGIDGWALALSLVGLVVGAAAWALGSHGQNYQQSFVGRRAVLISGLAALLIGAGPGIVNFFFNTGQGVH